MKRQNKKSHFLTAKLFGVSQRSSCYARVFLARFSITCLNWSAGLEKTDYLLLNSQ